jgi:hypothetical protein
MSTPSLSDSNLAGFTAVGFTPEQATLLDTLVNLLMKLSVAHGNSVLEEVAALRAVLMAKVVLTEAELEAERTRQQARFQSLLELEAMADPDVKQATEQLEDYLKRRAKDADPDGGPPSA